MSKSPLRRVLRQGEGQREVGRDSGRWGGTVGGGEGQWEVGRVGWQTEDEGEQLRVTG